MTLWRVASSARRLWPLLCAGVATAAAHPLHTSYAEADYRADSGKLEIALRLFSDDAEVALTARAGKKISLDKTPAAEFDALLLACIRDGARQNLRWVGRELKDGDLHLWLYVECPLPGGLAGAKFSNRLLRDIFSDQINSIRVRDRGPPQRQETLLFMTDTSQVVTFR
ncbi:MAG: hypothetical protein EXS32_02405 [Opitutus sp.]|nr:hypothetical protein [Opitutus sp.]